MLKSERSNDPSIMTRAATARRSPLRPLLFVSLLLLSLLATLTFATDAAAAAYPVSFTNLTGKRVFIAVATIDPGCYSCGALKFVRPPSATINGWYYLEPGKTRRFPAGYFHLTHQTSDQNRFTWSGFDDQTLLIHPYNGMRNAVADLFRERNGSLRLDHSTYSRTSQLVRDEGYREATFEKVDSGTLTISGGNPTYKIVSRTFDFDFGSHSSKTHYRCFTVPGYVMSTARQVNQRWTTGLIWDELSESACVTVITEGRQVRPFGPREKSYYTGWVKVYYTVPR